jgi:dipeptidyl aminopeptidase/acylaminoacyl peptidase
MSNKLNILLKCFPGDIVSADCYNNIKTAQKRPLLVFSHGFKGFKDWGGFPYMMQALANNGYAAVNFNFSFNGVDNSHPGEFTRLDLFAKNTFSKELDDLKIVLDFFYDSADSYSIDRSKIALIGHSRGGGISIIKASEDERVKCLVTLSSVSHFDMYSDEHKKKWKEQGYFEVLNTRTNQMMRLNSTLLDDLEQNKSRLDIISAVKKLRIPYLIIHGKEDLSVRFSEAEDLYKNSNKKSTELFEIENTGHTFGTAHPFKGTTKAFETVIDKIIYFLNKNL